MLAEKWFKALFIGAALGSISEDDKSVSFTRSDRTDDETKKQKKSKRYFDTWARWECTAYNLAVHLKVKSDILELIWMKNVSKVVDDDDDSAKLKTVLDISYLFRHHPVWNACFQYWQKVVFQILFFDSSSLATFITTI